jgi:hypothetical protein
LAGNADVESRLADKLKVTLQDRAVRYSYIDKQSFLEVRRVYQEKDGTSAQQMSRGHKRFGGVTRPTVFESPSVHIVWCLMVKDAHPEGATSGQAVGCA